MAVKAKDRSVHVRFALERACVVDQIARLKPIGAINDDVIQSYEFARICRIEADGDRIGGHQRIELSNAHRRDLGFRSADVRGREDRLPLQIALVHEIIVDHPDAPDARRRQVLQDRRAQAAGADAQDPRARKSLLPFHTHLGNEQVPAIAP